LLSGIVYGIYFYNKKAIALLLIFVFLGGSLAFVNTMDFAFNNVLKPHQKERVEILLGIKSDPHGTGYNVNQSIISIGSGGFAGKGYLKGTQTKFKFVPAQSTDFIFCTIGEEWGFLGSFVVIGLYVFLLLRLVILAERQRSVFSKIYGYGVISILFVHFFINIGMAIGLVPVIGIPLPFLSYGGSSLWGFTILLFIFLRLDASRTEYLV
jgi:rod shape determining protein RodA